MDNFVQFQLLLFELVLLTNNIYFYLLVVISQYIEIFLCQTKSYVPKPAVMLKVMSKQSFMAGYALHMANQI